MVTATKINPIMMKMALKEKKILVAISGGIAAYKSADLVRRLQERGAIVRVVMSHSAQAFISPLTLQALSGYPVASDLLDPTAEAAMGHIELARWADLVVIAPATANLIARIRAGMADELITAVCLATTSSIAICPAMNQHMYHNPATQDNLKAIKARGIRVWGPAVGHQACGDTGEGRMEEPLVIADRVAQYFAPKILAGRSVLITAGPTREAIDPVRYLSNYSSGKMGFALAKAAADMGAKVTLVSGPVALDTPIDVERIDVQSTQQMFDMVMTHVDDNDIFIGCAAVCDYRVATIAPDKIKKNKEQVGLELVRNPDILATVAALAPVQRPFTVGFAAETQDVEHYAKGKLLDKKLDMIAANDISDPTQGFNSDTNALSVFWPTGQCELPVANKLELSAQLIQLILQQMNRA